MIDLSKTSRIVLNDYSEYDASRCNNGGCYGFWTTYRSMNIIGNRYWMVSYGTTADMDFCTCCGSFGNHYNADEENYSCGEFELIQDKELRDIIHKFEETAEDNPDCYIEYFD